VEHASFWLIITMIPAPKLCCCGGQLGDMRDLSAFPDGSFDVVFNPHLTEAPHHADATGRYMPGYLATRAVKP
jgi:hypothetical protein